MKTLTPFFIPLCGIFGGLAGYFLWGGGKYTVFGLGVGFLVGVLFRLYQMHKPK